MNDWGCGPDSPQGCVSTLDPHTRWHADPGPELLRVPVGHGPVPVDLAGHLLITGPGGTALSRSAQAWLADSFSPDSVQFLVACLGHERITAPHVATDLHGLTEHTRVARAIDDEMWRRGRLSEAGLATEPALLLVFEDADATVAAIPSLLDVLHRVAVDGGALRMHLLLTATDPASFATLPVQRLSLDGHGGGVLGSTRFEVAALTPDQISEIEQSFFLYRHPVRSLLEAPEGLTYDRLLRYEQPADGEILLGVLREHQPTKLKFDFGTLSHVILRGAADVVDAVDEVRHTLLRRIADVYGPAGAAVVSAAELDRVKPILLARLRNRTSWQGPELFLVVDEQAGDQLLELADLLRHGSSIGVHLIAALEKHPLLRELPESDRLEIRAGPGGRAEYRVGTAYGSAQIALDVTEPVGELGALGEHQQPVARELTAVLGRTGIAEAVHLDVTTHTWCAGYLGSGKTAILRRIAVSLATRYPPDAVQLLIAEYDNDALSGLAALPNTAAYLSLWEVPDMRRFLALLDDEIRRRLHLEAEGLLAGAPRLVVLADGPRYVQAALPALGRTLRQVVALGRRLGISLVLTDRVDGAGEPDFAALERAITTRIGLQALSEEQLARYLHLPTPPKMVYTIYGQAYLRVGDGEPRLVRFEQVTPDELAEVTSRVRGPAVRALPLSPPAGMFGYDELERMGDCGGLPLGGSGSGPVGLDVEQHQHLLVLGEPRTGRSTVLRTLLRGIPRRYPVADCAVVLLRDMDTRDALPPEYVAGATRLQPPGEVLADLLGGLRRRLGNAWTGPRVFVVIDDLDQFSAQDDPLSALREVIPYAREIGLHFLVAGTSGIIMRPEVADLMDLGTPRLFLDEATHPGTAVGELPPIPAVGRGELLPWKQPVRLPWTPLRW
ncbi:FtsK/SpoIIIE domain-containing protein [Amycolatopsis lurida]